MTPTTYPTDLTDAQWENLLPYLPKPSPLGRPLKWEMRSIINAIFYIVKSGCQWRMLPHQLPHGKRSIPILESGKSKADGL